jgi:peptide/nickel transport system substrate-binding protein
MTIRRAVSRRQLLAAAGATVVAPAALAGCGRDRSQATPTQTATRSVAPKRGGHLKAAFVAGGNDSKDVTLAVLSTLGYVRARVVWDTIGELVDGKPVWRLAESVESNADATTWTVRLRDGVRFHTGKPLTANDVAFTLKTYVDTHALQGTFLGDIDFAKVRVRDPRTLELPLQRANGLLDLALAQSVFVFPDGTKDRTKAAGSGPYRDVSYTPGRGALLQRNDEYWDADNGGPYLDQLEFVNVPDAAARMNGLKSGQFHYAADVSLTVARAERDNRAVQLLISPKQLWSDVTLMANVAQPPFNQPEVVQALHYSVDRESLARTVGLGFGETGNDLLCAHDPYFDGDLPKWSYDPERAKSLLAKAGADGLQLTVRTADAQYGMLETATAWIGQAERAGITVKLDKATAANFYADMTKVLSTPLQTMVLAPQPLGLTAIYYYGSQAFFPVTGLTKTADPLLETVRTAATEQARTAALTDLQEFAHQHAGHVVPIRIPSIAAATQQVHGIEARGFAAYPSFRDAFLA